MAITSLTLSLAGCSTLLRGGGPRAALYTLTTLTDFSCVRRNPGLQLLIDRPTSSDALDTVRIALRRNEISFDYFADSAWTDSAPAMIQSLLVDSLQRSGCVAAVTRDTLAIHGNFELRIELRHFEAQYLGDTNLPTVRIELGLILVRTDDRRVVATRTVTAAAQPTRNAVPAIVAAFDTALHAAMRETLTWTLRTAH